MRKFVGSTVLALSTSLLAACGGGSTAQSSAPLGCGTPMPASPSAFCLKAATLRFPASLRSGPYVPDTGARRMRLALHDLARSRRMAI
jgi:hypothetical protein